MGSSADFKNIQGTYTPKTLEKFPKGLGEIYPRILEGIANADTLRAVDAVLKWILYAWSFCSPEFINSQTAGGHLRNTQMDAVSGPENLPEPCGP